MALQDISHLGFGGTKLNAELLKAIAELQGQKFSLVTGQDANDAIAITGIEYNDTLAAVLNLTDLTELDVADFTITDRRASGTLVLEETVADGDEIEVNGKTYTFVEVDETICYNAPPNVIPILPGPSGSDNAIIADRLAKVLMSSDKDLYAESDGVDTVTVKWRAFGVAGNAITMDDSGSNGHVTASGAVLEGGTATQSIFGADSTAAKKLLVIWWDKA